MTLGQGTALARIISDMTKAYHGIEKREIMDIKRYMSVYSITLRKCSMHGLYGFNYYHKQYERICNLVIEESLWYRC